MEKSWRIIEFSMLYIMAPLLVLVFHSVLKDWAGGRSFVVLFLPVIAVVLGVILFRQKKLSKRELFFVSDFKTHLYHILKIFLPVSLVLMGITYYFFEDLFFVLPQTSLSLWLMILFFYPLLSVLPQGMIYRVFFHKRYQVLFKNEKILLVASALSFCFCHLFFGNIYALVFTLLGGFLFAFRYGQTRSWLISSLEHALYGNLLFTIGLGKFLVS